MAKVLGKGKELPESKPNKQPTSVSVSINQPNLFYQTNGLTALSNDPSIMPRDTAGNVVITENSLENPYLVIETVTRKIDKKSFLNTVETRFNYFSFPAIIEPTSSIDLVSFETSSILIDPVYARFKPTEDRSILSNGIPAGILMDQTVDGLLQQTPNAYTITKEIKASGKDLRIRAKIQYRNDGPKNKVFFTMILNGPDRAELNRYFLPGYRIVDEDTSEALYYVSNDNNEIEITNTITGTSGDIGEYEIKVLYLDLILENSQFKIGDILSLGAFATGTTNTITAEQTYFVITDASKNVNEWNEPATEFTPILPIPTVYGEPVIVNINLYSPFGIAGQQDGEIRTLSAGGLNIQYVWDAETQTWEP